MSQLEAPVAVLCRSPYSGFLFRSAKVLWVSSTIQELAVEADLES